MDFSPPTGFALLTTMALLLSGCAAEHYIRSTDDHIVLYYQNRDAQEVLFASSLDRFTYHQAQKTDRSTWIIEVQQFSEFSYFYVVDGVVTLPDCEIKINDDFGGQNCFFLSGM